MFNTSPSISSQVTHTVQSHNQAYSQNDVVNNDGKDQKTPMFKDIKSGSETMNYALQIPTPSESLMNSIKN